MIDLSLRADSFRVDREVGAAREEMRLLTKGSKAWDQATSALPSTGGGGGHALAGDFSRLSTCVTRARLTPKNRASAARLSNLPVSSSDW